MHCNARTMIKIAAALGGTLAAVYLAVPEARELVAASAPLLLSLICPITMLAMMLMMRKSDDAQSRVPREPPQRPAPEHRALQAEPPRPVR